jgi:recombination protein RecR
MIYTSPAIEAAIEALSSLPTIGRKSAQRMALHLLRQPPEHVEKLASALTTMRAKVQYCATCFNFSEEDICPICASPKRNHRVICVVEEPSDVFAIERSGDYSGVYHVLHGLMNPLEGVSAGDLKVKELIRRLDGEMDEIILALSPTIDGEVTAQYIARLLKPIGIRVTRIARGVPVGSELEFVDDATIARALQSRVTA